LSRLAIEPDIAKVNSKGHRPDKEDPEPENGKQHGLPRFGATALISRN